VTDASGGEAEVIIHRGVLYEMCTQEILAVREENFDYLEERERE